MINQRWLLLIFGMTFYGLSYCQDTLIKPVFPKCSDNVIDYLPSTDTVVYDLSLIDPVMNDLYHKHGTLIVMDHYVTKDFDCVIFPARYKMYLPYIRFTPTRAEIDKAEHALTKQLYNLNKRSRNQSEPHFIDKHLSKYRRQYAGYISPVGQRVLLINCFLPRNDDFLSLNWSTDWTKEWMEIADGGEGVWEAKFSLLIKRLHGLHVHGCD